MTTGSALGSHAARHAAGGPDVLTAAALGAALHNIYRPEDHGLLSWSGDPGAYLSSTTIPTQGKLQMARLKIDGASAATPVTIGRIWICLGAGGTSLTSGQNFMGLFDVNENLLSATADQTTAWGTGGVKNPALTAAQAVTGDVFVGWYWNGSSTGPAFNRGSSNNGINIGLAAASSRWAEVVGSLTTALPNPAGTLVAGTSAFFVAVSTS